MYTFAFIMCVITAVFGFMAIALELIIGIEDEEGEDYGRE